MYDKKYIKIFWKFLSIGIRYYNKYFIFKYFNFSKEKLYGDKIFFRAYLPCDNF